MTEVRGDFGAQLTFSMPQTPPKTTSWSQIGIELRSSSNLRHEMSAGVIKRLTDAQSILLLVGYVPFRGGSEGPVGF